MLKTNVAPRLTLLDKFLPSRLVEYFMLNLPFKNIEKGVINITLFGRTHRFEGKAKGHHAELIIRHPMRAYWLIKTQGDLGFAQAYYEGAIETHSLYEMMYVGYENQDVFAKLLNNKKFNLLKLLAHRSNHNSIGNSRKNISYHYDLGNEFYQLWLDKTMSYSSAIFNENTHTLEQAQQAKYLNIIEDLQLKANDSVLEIGCGWGGFMEMALARNIEVCGLTLSQEQRKFVMQRLSNKFDPHLFDVKLQDYRLEQQQYDHIVSIEMFEAVGKEYWHEYFKTLQRSLKPGGKVAIQVITIAEEFAQEYQQSVDFIQAYIFPGGLLPSVKQLTELSNSHGFVVEKNYDFGLDYGVTCQLWKQAFNKHSEKLSEQGYDKAFQRLWNFYLDYCTVGFESGHISVNQIVLKREQVEEE